MSLRRGIDTERNLELFNELLRSRTKEICEELNTRWLASICDTIADFGNDIERRNAMLISLLVNMEKVAQSFLHWKANYKDPFEIPAQHEHRKVPLWDGMTSFHVVIGDVTNRLFGRLESLLEATPVLYAIYETVLQRIRAEPTILGTLNKHHKHVFEKDTKWFNKDDYESYRSSGEIPAWKYLRAAKTHVEGQAPPRASSAGNVA